MRVEIFKIKDIPNGKKYLLGNCNLYEFLTELPMDFFKFDIQRRIVENKFLDKLWDSVHNNIPIPAITLTSIGPTPNTETQSLDINNCEILDGLQRTFRLWSLYHIHKKYQSHKDKNYREFYDILKNDDEGGKYIVNYKIINRTGLKILIENSDGEARIDKILESFKRYELTLNIWFGLNDDEIVKQMLILNAGHKRVSKIHQFELIYLHYFENNNLNLPQGVKIMREKDDDYKLLTSPDTRQCGMYSLSSIMIAFLSYYSGRPQRVKPVNDINLDYENIEIAPFFSEMLVGVALTSFIDLLYKLDIKFSEDRNLSYWYSKDTTLSGIFAAFGSCVDSNMPYDDFTQLEQLINAIKAEDFKLEEYKRAYDNLASTTINVGTKVRNAIFYAVRDYISGKRIDWELAFAQK